MRPSRGGLLARNRAPKSPTWPHAPHFTPERRSNATPRDYDPMWAAIRAEAQADADAEPLLSSFLYASVLAHPSFDRALSFVLANRLACAQLLATQLAEICNDVLESEEEARPRDAPINAEMTLMSRVISQVRLAARCDLSATRARDPACRTHADALLYFKGYHAVQAYRIAHALWHRGQTLLAFALQSRISEVFAVDIHPAARIGRGILLDHGTGVVIGETAVVGDRVSILQGVTLGGTGKETGDRHPKIGEGVLIGAHATILGNISIGEGAMIAAGSLVLKPVGAHVMVAGAPAKEVGKAAERFPALTMLQDEFCAEWREGEAARGEGGVPATAPAGAGEYSTGS